MSLTKIGTETKKSPTNNGHKLNYSFNPKIKQTYNKKEAASESWGWETKSVEWDKSSLTEMVKNTCYIPSKLIDGHKVKDSVTEVYFLPLDFDEGTPTVEEFIKEASNWDFSWFLHTTVSHRKEKTNPIDRFRVLIPFSNPISREQAYSLKEYWNKIYNNMDTTCFQGERYYYRNPNAETYLHTYTNNNDEVIWWNPIDVLTEISDEDITPKQKNNPKKIKTKTLSNNGNIKRTDHPEKGEESFGLDFHLTLDDNRVVKVKEIEGYQSIFCPFCIHDKTHRNNPDSANAFIDKNSSGTYYIYCASKDLIYWQESADKSGIYKTDNNQYMKMVKRNKEWTEIKLSSFVIHPKELLVLDDGDSLRCNVVNNKGFRYEDILIENKDWHSKTKLLSAIGHQDCTFLGSDTDVQVLCDLISQKVPIRKTGTKVLGLHDDNWVMDNININSKGINKKPSIVPSEKGGESFHRKISYPEVSINESTKLIKEFYDNILDINDHVTIVPFISWSFISPIKPIILKRMDGFPHLFVHGAQGSGKTSSALMMMKLFGYNTSGTFSCTLNPFPMLKLMSSTNAIPIVFDEFKKQDLTQYQVDQILRMMRKAYSNEVETKGKADQTTVDYHLTAPMIVMGEWNTTQPAIRERIIVSSFTNAVKNSKKMQQAFNKIKQIPLESFMNSYIPFILSQDTDKLIVESQSKIEDKFKDKNIAPRVLNNLSIMYAGYLLFIRFAEVNNIQIKEVDIDGVLEFQLREITGSNTGQVESAVDQLLEGLSTMAAGGYDIGESYDYKKMTDKDGIDGIAIQLKVVMPKFKEWVRRTSYDIELLDQKSYIKLFNDTEYIVDKEKIVNFHGKAKRCLFIDIEKAKNAGVDLEGFINITLTEQEQLQANRESYM